MQRGMSRRGFLTASGALALGAGALPLLSACSSQDTADLGAANAKVKLPDYIPVAPAAPDLPGNAAGAMPGYFDYPRNPAPAFQTPPAAGLDGVSIMYSTYSPVPPGVGSNTYWQQLNKQAGTSLNFIFTSGADYPTKFQTTVAGGNIPDIMGVPSPVPDQPQLMKSLYADLTPYLSGSAVKQYPYLANFPTDSWKYTIADGGIYAVPQPRAAAGHVLFYRPDIFAQVGANPQTADYPEFLALMRAVTDAKSHRWAFYSATFMLEQLQMMLGAPNGWTRQANGDFTSTYADERTKQALGLVASMIKEGLFHPDAASADFNADRAYFTGGQIAMHGDGYAQWDTFVSQTSESAIGAIVPPHYAGGGDAAHFAGSATQAITAIRRGLPEDHTRKLLNLLNFLAAPIGTAEHLARKYGVEGVDYTWQGGIPQLTKRGSTEKLDVQYVTDAPTILGPAPRARVTAQHSYQVRITKTLIKDPTVGLYSNTSSTKGSTLQTLIQNAQNDIFFGRKPLSSWDDAVKQWRAQGGDTIAKEYAKAAS